MTEADKQELALFFHRHSDHGRDGADLGSDLCNCYDTMARVRMLLEQNQGMAEDYDSLKEHAQNQWNLRVKAERERDDARTERNELIIQLNDVERRVNGLLEKMP